MQYKKAMQAINSGGLAQASDEVLIVILAINPQVNTHPTLFNPASSPIQITEMIIKALKLFPNDSNHSNLLSGKTISRRLLADYAKNAHQAFSFHGQFF